MNNSILDESNAHDDYQSILAWWEGKRLIYNLVIIIVGLLVFLFKIPFSFNILLTILASGLLFLLFANICYCAGWILEVFAFYHQVGHQFLKEIRILIFVVGCFLVALMTLGLGLAAAEFAEQKIFMDMNGFGNL